MSAVQLEKLTLAQYARAIVDLAYFNHAHVALNDQVLFEIFSACVSENLSTFEIACEHIGTETADMLSHANVVALFVRRVWSPILSERLPKHEAATSILLRSLLFNRPAEEAKFYAARLMFNAPAAFLGYFVGWLRGHFFDVRRVIHMKNSLETRMSHMLLGQLISTYTKQQDPVQS